MFRNNACRRSFFIQARVKDNLQDQFSSMDIVEAADGVEAFRKINAHPPNQIFIDTSLPRENGLELTRRIKPDYPDFSIIILKSHDLPESREEPIRSKADYLFSKGEAISNDGIFTLAKSISSEKGFNGHGSERR